MKKKSFLNIVLACLLAIGLVTITACGGNGNQNTKPVKSIAVTPPTKTEYYVGDEFSADGGYITVTYEDGTEGRVEFTDEGVEMTAPKMDSTGKKTITVKYGGKRATFNIVVNMLTYKVTLDYNYDGATNGTAEVDQGAPLDKPQDPVRANHSFEGWFTDKTCTVAYDFTQNVDAPFTLYARWLKNGASHDFTFDFNRTGIKNPVVVLRYESGAKAVKYAVDPERTGYKFDGWFTEAVGGSKYDFNTALTADVTVYAHWTKTVSGVNEWKFEAENIDLSKMSGPGFSGTVSKGGMLYNVTDKNASGNRYLGNLYKNGSTAKFCIDSDEAVDGVKFVVSLSMEGRDYTFKPSNYKIKVNDAEINYSDIVFKNVPAASNDKVEIVSFKDFEISASVSLKKGANVIEFVTSNSDSLAGTTITAAAPLIDCIKLTTTAVLSWDGGKNLPMLW